MVIIRVRIVFLQFFQRFLWNARARRLVCTINNNIVLMISSENKNDNQLKTVYDIEEMCPLNHCRSCVQRRINRLGPSRLVKSGNGDHTAKSSFSTDLWAYEFKFHGVGDVIFFDIFCGAELLYFRESMADRKEHGKRFFLFSYNYIIQSICFAIEVEVCECAYYNFSIFPTVTLRHNNRRICRSVIMFFSHNAYGLHERVPI